MGIKKKKRKSKKKSTRKRISVKKKTVAKKKASPKNKKRRKNKIKVAAKNPMPVFYVGYITGENGKKYYYHGYDRKKKRLIFDDRMEGALWYRSPIKTVDEISHMLEAHLTKREIYKKGFVKAEKYKPPK